MSSSVVKRPMEKRMEECARQLVIAPQGAKTRKDAEVHARRHDTATSFIGDKRATAHQRLNRDSHMAFCHYQRFALNKIKGYVLCGTRFCKSPLIYTSSISRTPANSICRAGFMARAYSLSRSSRNAECLADSNYLMRRQMCRNANRVAAAVDLAQISFNAVCGAHIMRQRCAIRFADICGQYASLHPSPLCRSWAASYFCAIPRARRIAPMTVCTLRQFRCSSHITAIHHTTGDLKLNFVQ